MIVHLATEEVAADEDVEPAYQRLPALLLACGARVILAAWGGVSSTRWAVAGGGREGRPRTLGGVCEEDEPGAGSPDGPAALREVPERGDLRRQKCMHVMLSAERGPLMRHAGCKESDVGNSQAPEQRRLSPGPSGQQRSPSSCSRRPE